MHVLIDCEELREDIPEVNIMEIEVGRLCNLEYELSFKGLNHIDSKLNIRSIPNIN